MSFLTALRSFVPPPQYLRIPHAGVDISDTSLKYILFADAGRTGAHKEIATWGELPIPEETLSGGEIKNTERLIKVLTSLRQQLPTPYVRVSLPEEKAYLFETEIKRGTSYKEIRGQLEFHLEENVPLSPRDAFFDYAILEEGGIDDSLTVSVTVYARDVILNYYEVLHAAGLIPVAFEVEAQAIARAVLPEHDLGTHLIVDFGKTRTGIGIVYRNKLTYTSTIELGGAELSTALRRQLGDLPEEELTTIKNSQGLFPGVASHDVRDALISTMSAIKDEIALRIQYWDSHSAELPGYEISSVILCGGSANLKGLSEYLRETLGVEVELAAVWQHAFSLDEYVPAIDKSHSLGYATAIGLALGNYS